MWIGQNKGTKYLHKEVSFLRENSKVVFTKIAGDHVLSKFPKVRLHPLEH